MTQENGITKKITIKGLVQGIGYRPFLAELAERCKIGGWVRNAGGLVTVLASGRAEDMACFLQGIECIRPEGAVVERIVCEDQPFQRFPTFQIKESGSDGSADEGWYIPADLPTCGSCLREMHDPANRRYRHPFISCTACGPRYSMIEALPYDRKNCAMRVFPMCVKCGGEYRKQGDRRRHAQTIACPDCGPTLTFSLTGAAETLHGEEALDRAVHFLRGGGIAAVKDIGGYHLVCTPFSEIAVQKLRQLKGRESKPLPLCSLILLP